MLIGQFKGYPLILVVKTEVKRPMQGIYLSSIKPKSKKKIRIRHA